MFKVDLDKINSKKTIYIPKELDKEPIEKMKEIINSVLSVEYCIAKPVTNGYGEPKYIIFSDKNRKVNLIIDITMGGESRPGYGRKEYIEKLDFLTGEKLKAFVIKNGSMKATHKDFIFDY